MFMPTKQSWKELPQQSFSNATRAHAEIILLRLNFDQMQLNS